MASSSEQKSVTNDIVFFYEDHAADELTEKIVGRKGCSLFQLKDYDVPVPPFFVIGAMAFDAFMDKALRNRSLDALYDGNTVDPLDVEKAMLAVTFPSRIEEEILTNYSRLSGFADSWVAVRSSVVYTKDEKVQFAGLLDTALNVKGNDDLLSSVKYIYASLFKDKVRAYCESNAIDMRDIKVAVAVQKMIQSEVSGVTYTVDPVTQNQEVLSIDAVYGLGNVITSGEITPDTYVLAKKDLKIMEKHICPQEWMYVRNFSRKKANFENQQIDKVRISSLWSHQQKIEDRSIDEIAKVSILIEDKYDQPQNVEWVWESGNLWILQSKPLFEHKQEEYVANVLDEEETLRIADLFKPRTSPTNVESVKVKASDVKLMEKFESQKVETEMALGDEYEWEYILSGVAASAGIVHGEVLKIHENFSDPVYGKILLIDQYEPSYLNYIYNSAGIILDNGAMSSDLAAVCRERNIPLIVSTVIASNVLEDKDYIKINGSTGEIFKKGPKNKDGFESKVLDQVESSQVASEFLSKINMNKSLDLGKISLKRQAEAIAEPEVESEDQETNTQDVVDISTATHVYVNMTADSIKADNLAGALEYVRSSDGLCYLDLDEIVLTFGVHPLMYWDEDRQKTFCDTLEKRLSLIAAGAKGKEVIISVGSKTVGEFRALSNGKTYEPENLSDNTFGLSRYLSEPQLFKKMLRIIRRVRTLYGFRNVSIALHSPINSAYVSEAKKLISAAGLRRSATFKIYAVLDLPGEVLLANDIFSAEVDGLILNTPRMAQSMYGVFVDQGIKTDLDTGSILKIIESMPSELKSNTTVICQDSKTLIKKSIDVGISSVSVLPDFYNKGKKLIADLEVKKIF